jgi:cytoskeleton protein RodZ
VEPQAGGEVRGQIGARLKAARQRRGLTLFRAAEKLHVDLRVLEALESEQFAELGAAVFVRGHVRHYAELVGESPQELLSLYAASAHADSAPDLTRVPGPEPAREARALWVPGLLVVITVALIGTIWWVAGSLKPPPGPAGTGSGAPGSSAQRSSAAPAAAIVDAPGAAAAPDMPSARRSVPSQARSGASAPERTTDASAAAEGAPLTGNAALVTHGSEHARVTEITLHFAEESWAEVYDAHGQRLFYDVGAADSVRSLQGSAPLRVVLGNAAGVTLDVNGRRVPIPESTGGSSLEFQVNRSGHVAPAHLAAAPGRGP